MTRRDLFAALPLTAVPAGAEEFALHDDGPPVTPGLTVRMTEPRNLESPYAFLNDFITPTEQFFVRSHFAVPALDAKTFTLKVEGAVENPLSLSLEDLKSFDSVTKPITMECAGNGRVFLAPTVPGLQWGQGAVSTATWTGIPLKAVLGKAKLRNTAVEVVLEGADIGSVNADPKSPGPISYARSIPLTKAKKDEVILATHMNGQPLTAAHGFPIRAVVGGWYGMASVKWLTRIIVADTAFKGFWQTLDYSIFDRTGTGIPSLKPVTTMQPKAQIMRPALGEVVKAGSKVTVKGAAWAGEETLAKVELSTDGGLTWKEAKMLGDKVPLCWRHWEYTWEVPAKPGAVKLIARATDVKGTVQPKDRDPDRRTYMINHWVPVDVEIR